MILPYLFVLGIIYYQPCIRSRYYIIRKYQRIIILLENFKQTFLCPISVQLLFIQINASQSEDSKSRLLTFRFQWNKRLCSTMHTRIFFDILSRRGIDCIDLQYKIYESKYTSILKQFERKFFYSRILIIKRV